MSERAMRHNKGKVRLSLIPAEAILGLASVYMAGTKKYADHNWRKGAPFSEGMDSLERHYNKFKHPAMSDHDEETGLHHLWHVAWNAITLAIYSTAHPDKDDRYKEKKDGITRLNELTRPGTGESNKERFPITDESNTGVE